MALKALWFNLSEMEPCRSPQGQASTGQTTNSASLGFSHGAGMQTLLAVLTQALFPVLSCLPPTVCFFKGVFAQRGIVLLPYTEHSHGSLQHWARSALCTRSCWGGIVPGSALNLFFWCSFPKSCNAYVSHKKYQSQSWPTLVCSVFFLLLNVYILCQKQLEYFFCRDVCKELTISRFSFYCGNRWFLSLKSTPCYGSFLWLSDLPTGVGRSCACHCMCHRDSVPHHKRSWSLF